MKKAYTALTALALLATAFPAFANDQEWVEGNAEKPTTAEVIKKEEEAKNGTFSASYTGSLSNKEELYTDANKIGTRDELVLGADGKPVKDANGNYVTTTVPVYAPRVEGPKSNVDRDLPATPAKDEKKPQAGSPAGGAGATATNPATGKKEAAKVEAAATKTAAKALPKTSAAK